MIKGIISCFFLMIIIEDVTSQNFGISFGLNSSIQNHQGISFSEDFESFGNRLGLRFGLDYKYHLGNNLYFLTGVNYNQKGGNRNGNENESDNVRENKVRLNYVEVPMTFLITNSRKIAPYGLLGFYTGYLLNGEYDDLDFIEVFELNKRLDIGARFGVGINCHNFTVGLNYDLGLRNIDNSQTDVISKNRNISLILSYWPKF